MTHVYKNDETRCAAVTTKMARCKQTKHMDKNFCKLHLKYADQFQEDSDSFESNTAEVVSGIFLGSLDTTRDPIFLKKYKIKNIVNCSGFEPPKKFEQLYKKLGIRYYTLTTFKYRKDRKTGQMKKKDLYMVDCPFNSRENPQVFYDYCVKGVAMIRDAKKKGGNILINCFAGINRSSACLCAYMMTRTKRPYTFKQAYKKIVNTNKKRGLDALNNRDFRYALKLFPTYQKLTQRKLMMGGQSNKQIVRISSSEINALKRLFRKYSRK